MHAYSGCRILVWCEHVISQAVTCMPPTQALTFQHLRGSFPVLKLVRHIHFSVENHEKTKRTKRQGSRSWEQRPQSPAQPAVA